MVALFCLLFVLQNVVLVESKLKPVIIVHGLGGVQLDAKLNRRNTTYPFCVKFRDWFQIWFSLTEYVFDTDCFVDNVKLIFDPRTNSMVNQEGVDIRTAGVWGDVNSVSYLDPSLQYLTRYLYPVVTVLRTSFGYTNMDTMFALHYDFRRIGDIREMNKYFERVTSFIENLYARKREKVIFVSHSMGGPVTAHFIKSKTPQWKEKYIDSWYSINGALGGSTQATISALVSNSLGVPVPIRPQRKFLPFLSSMVGLYFLMPSISVFPRNQTIITINNINYTVEKARDFVISQRFPQMAKVLPNIPDPFVSDAPNVVMECVYGSGVATESRIVFKEGSVDKSFLLFSSDGDGTVNIESLSSCEYWRKKSLKPFHSTVFPGFSHNGILSQKKFLQHLQDFVAARNKITSFNREILLD